MCLFISFCFSKMNLSVPVYPRVDVIQITSSDWGRNRVEREKEEGYVIRDISLPIRKQKRSLLVAGSILHPFAYFVGTLEEKDQGKFFVHFQSVHDATIGKIDWILFVQNHILCKIIYKELSQHINRFVNLSKAPWGPHITCANTMKYPSCP